MVAAESRHLLCPTCTPLLPLGHAICCAHLHAMVAADSPHLLRRICRVGREHELTGCEPEADAA